MKKHALILSTLALAAALTATLVGCQGQKSPEELIKADLTQQFDEVKNADSDSWSEEFGMTNEDFAELGVDANQFMGAYLDGFDYKIGDITVDKDKGTATAKVDITCKQFDEIFSTWFGTYLGKAMSMLDASEEEIIKLAGETLMDATKSATAKTVACELAYAKNSEGEWEADQDVFEAQLYHAMGLETLLGLDEDAQPANAA